MALVINLDQKAKDGKWFDFADGVSALILPYFRSVIRKTLREATVPVAQGDGSPSPDMNVDPELWDRRLYRNIIKDIKGLVDPQGNPVSCSDEVIDLVCDQVEGFAVWAITKSLELAQATAARAQAETKNSKRSRGGKKPAPEA